MIKVNDNKDKEGWSINVTSKNHNHYYKDGLSLCKRAKVEFFMDSFDKSEDFSVILGYNCSICSKLMKKLNNK